MSGRRSAGDGIVTGHAVQRSRERLGIPKKSVERNARKALEHGVHRLKATGKLRRYLDYLWWHGKTPMDGICVYHRNVYIFAQGILVTVFPLPKIYHEAADKAERKLKESQHEH